MRYTALIAILLLASPVRANGPNFGNAGGIGSSTSIYSGGEPTGGTFNINGSTGAAMVMAQTVSGVSAQDLSLAGVNPGNIIKIIPGNAVTFCPILSCISTPSNDHQRTSALFAGVTQVDGEAEEQTVAIHTVINTGYSSPIARSTAYALGANGTVDNAVYRVIQAGTTASTGGPPGTRPASVPFNYTDGSVIWTWINDAAIDAKNGIYNEVSVNPGAGSSWAQANNIRLNSGYSGSFAVNTEFDLTNNAGTDSTIGGSNRYNLYIENLGTNKSTSAVEIGSANTSSVSSIWGIHISGTQLSSNSVIGIDASSLNGIGIGTGAGGAVNPTFTDSVIKDGGATANYGIFLGGSYANQAIYAGGITSNANGTGTNQGQIIISPNTGTSRLQLGYVFNSGVTEYGRIQTSNSSGATPLEINQGGGVVLFGPDSIQLTGTTVAALGTCSASLAGIVKFAIDTNAPAYGATITTGGGGTRVLALCNGTNWTAH